ncbi:MAG: methyltransferase FkbM family protein [Acidobacteriaceae bacterium]|nr:methyltransferase FkbM family protein [Acidobacteriaceae bacterium]
MIVRIVCGQLKGKKWIVDSQRHSCWLGTYERDVQDLFAREVKPGAVFYDIGANVGFYTLLGSMLVDSGHVFAFEPLPKNVQYLKRHLHLNKMDNVEVFEIAVSNEVGTSLFRQEDTGAMGRLQADGDLRVLTETIDSLLQQNKIAPPDYIKMDIEGAEFKALLGASRCFRMHSPKLLLATHGIQVHDDCCQLLRSWNYNLQLISPPNEGRAEIYATPFSKNANSAD